MIDQRPDRFNRDADFVTDREREFVWRHDASARQQKTAVRKRVVAEEIFDQFFRRALQLTQPGLAVKGGRVGANDFQMNLGLRGQRLRADQDAGAETAAFFAVSSAFSSVFSESALVLSGWLSLHPSRYRAFAFSPSCHESM